MLEYYPSFGIIIIIFTNQKCKQNSRAVCTVAYEINDDGDEGVE